MKKLTLMQKIYLYLALPFSILGVALKYLFTPTERNAIHNGKPLKGIKKGVLSKNISVEDVKKECKKLNATINDVIMALTSMTLKEYLESKGDTKTSYINLSVPYSLRPPP